VVSRNLAQPETDLGVMTAPAATQEAAAQAPVLDLPLPAEESVDVPELPEDVPAMPDEETEEGTDG
jgi:hypothetical protein